MPVATTAGIIQNTILFERKVLRKIYNNNTEQTWEIRWNL